MCRCARPNFLDSGHAIAIDRSELAHMKASAFSAARADCPRHEAHSHRRDGLSTSTRRRAARALGSLPRLVPIALACLRAPPILHAGVVPPQRASADCCSAITTPPPATPTRARTLKTHRADVGRRRILPFHVAPCGVGPADIGAPGRCSQIVGQLAGASVALFLRVFLQALQTDDLQIGAATARIEVTGWPGARQCRPASAFFRNRRSAKRRNAGQQS